jgi:chemotaxis protein CheX
MQQDVFPHFIQSTQNVLQILAELDCKVGTLGLKRDSKTFGEVTGNIEMLDPKGSLTLTISFEEKVILYVVSKMMMEEITTIDENAIDTVGEITNMICGGAKAGLSPLGYVFNMARPSMIQGKHIDLTHQTQLTTYTIPFSTLHGSFVLDFTIHA